MIPYDFIGHFEDFAVEAGYILSKLEPNQTVKQNLNLNQQSNNVAWLQQVLLLPHSLVSAVAQQYAIDFDMFGYEIKDFL